MSLLSSGWWRGGAVATQQYGCTTYEFEPYSPSCPTHHFHSGVDVALACGTPLYMAQGGQVLSIGNPAWAGPFAPKIRLDGDPNHDILLAHVQQVYAHVGDPLAAGAHIADVGNKGHSFGCHLHFEVDQAGTQKSLNPMPFLNLQPPITVEQARAFVARVYLDVLGRAPDPTGGAGYIRLLTSGTGRSDVALAIATSDEAVRRTIGGFYWSYLHRQDPGPGIDGWRMFFRGGASWNQIRAKFLASPEYFSSRGRSTNDGWLNAVYVDVLDRPPDASGRASWEGQLARGVSREVVATAIVGSKEAYTDLVSSWYYAYLHRAVDQGGRDNNVAALQGGWREEHVLANLLGSDEYLRDAGKVWISPTTWYSIVNRNSGKCVDARLGGVANGTTLQQYHCNGTYAQQFQFQPASDGYYRVVNRNAPNQVWDVNRISTDDGALVQLWAWNGGVNQQWLPVPEGNGHYHFIVRQSGKCLDVPYAQVADSIQLQQYHCNGTAAQSCSLTPH